MMSTPCKRRPAIDLNTLLFLYRVREMWMRSALLVSGLTGAQWNAIITLATTVACSTFVCAM